MRPVRFGGLRKRAGVPQEPRIPRDAHRFATLAIPWGKRPPRVDLGTANGKRRWGAAVLISAIMITGKSAERRKFAQVAIRCFLEQTHAERELVIVNDGAPLLDGPPDVRLWEIRLPFSPGTTLGDLRNLGLGAARGELAIQWDDDDWHHPRRMEVQAAHWSEGAAVLLRQQVRYSIPSATAFVHGRARGIEGTILHQKRGVLGYPSERKREDTLFLQQFGQIKIVDAVPTLYVRFFHGANTWDERHIMGALADPASRGKWRLRNEESTALRAIFEKHYREVFSWPGEGALWPARPA